MVREGESTGLGLDEGDEGGGATGMVAWYPARAARQSGMLITHTGNLKDERGLLFSKWNRGLHLSRWREVES